MSMIEQTIQVAFKGVPFYVREETLEGGRKTAIHDFPGRDFRVVEDLGKMPGSFEVRGFVAGDDWLERTKRLTTALESEEAGELEMSSFGVYKVKATTFTKEISQRELGKTFFTMTFLVTDPDFVQDKASEESVATASDNALIALQAFFEGLYEGVSSGLTAVAAAYDAQQTANTIIEDTASITGDTLTLKGAISDLIRDPLAFGSAFFRGELLGDLFKGMVYTREASRKLSKLCRIGYNLAQDYGSIQSGSLVESVFGFDVLYFPLDTIYRILNNKNRGALVYTTRASIFSIYMLQVARNDYATDTEITEVIQDIQDIYAAVILNDIISPEAAYAVDLCRIETLEVLSNKAAITPNVVDFELNTKTVDMELAYRLYAETRTTPDLLSTRSQELSDLNDLLPNRFDGTVQVFR